MLFSGVVELLMGNENLMRRKSIRGIIFPGEGNEPILVRWEDSRYRKNSVIPYIKATKKNFFYNLDNFKN